VEAGLVHFAESPEGWLLICLRSLLKESRNKSTPAAPLKRGTYGKDKNMRKVNTKSKLVALAAMTIMLAMSICS